MGKAVLALSVGVCLVVACGDGSILLQHDGSVTVTPSGQIHATLTLKPSCITAASGSILVEEEPGYPRAIGWAVDLADGPTDHVALVACCVRPTAVIRSISGAAHPC